MMNSFTGKVIHGPDLREIGAIGRKRRSDYAPALEERNKGGIPSLSMLRKICNVKTISGFDDCSTFGILLQ